MLFQIRFVIFWSTNTVFRIVFIIFRIGNAINWRQEIMITAIFPAEEARSLALAQEIAEGLKANAE